MKRVFVCTIVVLILGASSAHAFLEDICLPRPGRKNQVLMWCINPTCLVGSNVNRACPQQTADFATIEAGRSMIHHDSTYFIAQSLGYRADVAYWIAAYNEVADYTQYVPIDQCGKQASTSNSGASYITAQFNGFQRTNLNTDGPLDHYVVSYSPNGQGTDVHGAMGVQALYPLYYPRPGYPLHIDDTYQKTLANLRQWAMLPTDDPGLLCTVGYTDGKGGCMTGGNLVGTVPLLKAFNNLGFPLKGALGRKVLNYVAATNNQPAQVTYYEQLQTVLNASNGRLWLASTPVPVPLQVARIGLYLHVLQDTSSHSTYCGDDSPSVPGGQDPGTWMTPSGNDMKVMFGVGCASSPHLAGHVQETGTGSQPLPLRDYVALNNTVDELIAFGNQVAKQQDGWIVNPQLLPPDTSSGKNALGQSADDIKAALVGTIAQGTAYSRAEVYQSGLVTLQLQQTNALDRLNAMNAALAQYSTTLAAQSPDPSKFVPFAPLPGNSPNKTDQSVCWQ